MIERDPDEVRLFRERFHRASLKALFYPLIPLFLLSWWKRGFWTALIASVALYAFLVLLLYLATWFEEWKLRKRS
jgi:hypothetical protein